MTNQHTSSRRGAFQIYKNQAGSYTWWLIDAEQGIMAHAPAHYPTMNTCLEAIEQVKQLAATAVIEALQPTRPA